MTPGGAVGGTRTALFTHAACLEHAPGPGHPESPSRLRAVLAALDDPCLAALERLEAPRATREQLLRVHAAALVDAVLAPLPAGAQRRLDADTVQSPGSAEAALRAAGAACAAIDAVMDGSVRRAFCAVRPPGHHATASQAMGFCLFNNVAVGAAHALAVHGLERIAIVDFDVHHGNGTADSFRHEPRVLYASTHQWPLYPGTGASEDRGEGNLVNVPLPSGAGSVEFRRACEDEVLPALDAFRPQLVLVSAGFDAHRRDPLANLSLETDDYGWITARLVELAVRHAGGRLVSTLEGGYDLTALADSAAVHVQTLMTSP
jgi:acetoin utilization deacetylase AcuC-like enzyme